MLMSYVLWPTCHSSAIVFELMKSIDDKLHCRYYVLGILSLRSRSKSVRQNPYE